MQHTLILGCTSSNFKCRTIAKKKEPGLLGKKFSINDPEMDHQNILPKSGDRIAIFYSIVNTTSVLRNSNTGINSMYTSVNAGISNRY